MLILLKYYTLLCVLLCLVYVTGAVLRYLYSKYVQRNNDALEPQSIFVSLLVGITAIVTVFSIYITNGKTIHWLFLFAPVGLIIAELTKAKGADNLDKPTISFTHYFTWRTAILPLLLCMLAALPFLLYEASYFIKSGEFPYKTTDIDFSFYGIFSESIFYSGNENKFTTLNFTMPQLFNGCVPYHYFELHLNSFIAHLFSLPSVPALMLLTYPLLNVIVLAGLVYILHALSVKLNVKYAILLVVVMGISGIYLDIYAGFDFLKYGSGLTNASPLSLFGKKMLPLLCLPYQ